MGSRFVPEMLGNCLVIVTSVYSTRVGGGGGEEKFSKFQGFVLKNYNFRQFSPDLSTPRGEVFMNDTPSFHMHRWLWYLSYLSSQYKVLLFCNFNGWNPKCCENHVKWCPLPRKGISHPKTSIKQVQIRTRLSFNGFHHIMGSECAEFRSLSPTHLHGKFHYSGDPLRSYFRISGAQIAVTTLMTFVENFLSMCQHVKARFLPLEVILLDFQCYF